MTEKLEKAILAGGCFWGVQDLIRRQPGVISTRVGYSGGDVPNATYRNHGTHAEAVEITFDPTQTTYRDLLEFFFQIHDPTTVNRQGNDAGTSYRSAIFYTSDDQKRSRWTPSRTSKPRVCGPARSSRRSRPPDLSGRPSPSTRTICRSIQPATPVISCGRAGSSRTVRTRSNGSRRWLANGSLPEESSGHVMDEQKARTLLEGERRQTRRRLSQLLGEGQDDRAAANEPGDMFDSAQPLTQQGTDDAVIGNCTPISRLSIERSAASKRERTAIRCGPVGRSPTIGWRTNPRRS